MQSETDTANFLKALPRLCNIVKRATGYVVSPSTVVQVTIVHTMCREEVLLASRRNPTAHDPTHAGSAPCVILPST